MGTSVNQRSPRTDNWELVQGAYGDPRSTPAEILSTVWRAASNPREQNLAALLAEHSIATLCDQVASADPPGVAAAKLRDHLAESKTATLATDIAVRATIQSLGSDDLRAVYVRRLFAEATAYLVERDLPAFLGSSERFGTVGAVQSLVSDLTGIASEAAAGVDLPSSDAVSWRGFVGAVLTRIRRQR